MAFAQCVPLVRLNPSPSLAASPTTSRLSEFHSSDPQPYTAGSAPSSGMARISAAPNPLSQICLTFFLSVPSVFSPSASHHRTSGRYSASTSPYISDNLFAKAVSGRPPARARGNDIAAAESARPAFGCPPAQP